MAPFGSAFDRWLLIHYLVIKKSDLLLSVNKFRKNGFKVFW